MIDSHAHLDLPAFDNDIDDVLSRASKAGVTRIHVPGTTRVGWQSQKQLAAQYPCIDYSFGLHPYFLTSSWQQDVDQLAAQFSANTAPIALGEIGLDGVIEVDFSQQQAAFEQQLGLANELSLPVVLHHRKTHHELLASLKRTRFTQGGVIHAFSGSIEVAKAYIDKGFKLGIGGTVTYARGAKTKRTLENVSLADILLETDSPDMPISGYQGQRNEPSRLVHVVDVLSELYQVSKSEIIATTSDNYFSAFCLS